MIDESFWQTFQKGGTIDVTDFARGHLETPVLREAGDTSEMVPDLAGTDTLRSLHMKVGKAISVHPHTYFERRPLIEAGLTREDCETAKNARMAAISSGTYRPDMPIEERRRAAKDAAYNTQLPCLVAFWEALGELLAGGEEATGRVELEVVVENRERRSLVHLHLLRNVTPALQGLPVLMLDGTGDLEVIRRIFPEAELVAEVWCRCPHQKVHQITGPFSMTSLRNRRDLLERIRDFVALKSEGEPTLVVTNLEFEDVFRHDAVERVFDGMQNVEVAHYGAVAGGTTGPTCVTSL